MLSGAGLCRRYLMALYDALLVALKRAVAVLEDTTANLSAAASTCLEAVFDVFAPPDSGEPLLPYEFDLGENLDVSVQFADAYGDTVDSATASSGHRRLLVYVTLSPPVATAAGDGSGSALPLSHVRSVCQVHQGRVAQRAEQGGGRRGPWRRGRW